MLPPYQCIGLFWCAVFPDMSQHDAVTHIRNQDLSYPQNDDQAIRLNDICYAMQRWNAAVSVVDVGTGRESRTALRQHPSR